MTDCVVADLGGTFLRCAVVRAGTELTALERIRLPGTAASRRPEIWNEIVEAIARYIDRHAAHIRPSTPIGFAFPGPIVGGAVTAAPTVRGGGAIPDVGSMLAERTGRTIGIVNDVSAAAWYFAERRTVDRFIVVTVSSGIGAKMFDRRHPGGVFDDTSFAGEIGHLVVDRTIDAPLCDCGGTGHLGAIASARGLERSVRAQARRDVAGFARSALAVRFGATPATLTNELHLLPALRAGDPWAMRLLRASIEPLAAVLRALCVGSGIEAVVLMGGFVQALGEPYRALVADAIGMLSDCGPARSGRPVTVMLATAGEEPSLLGAAAFMRRLQPVS